MKLKNFFCQFPNPWALRVSGMGGYTSKCEKKSKSLHLSADSGRVSSLLVYINVHSPVDYVSFDFLHKVDCHQLGWFFF